MYGDVGGAEELGLARSQQRESGGRNQPNRRAIRPLTKNGKRRSGRPTNSKSRPAFMVLAPCSVNSDCPMRTTLTLFKNSAKQARDGTCVFPTIRSLLIAFASKNGDQAARVTTLAMKRGKSVDFIGYWQRHSTD